jgi:hypothetical protein
VSKQDKADRNAGDKQPREGGWGDLTEAARELEQELKRFEDLTAAARRMPLDTKKGLERAAKATAETAVGQERVDRALGALVAAIAAVRARHEANVATLNERGEEIRLRAEALSPLVERFGALGEEGRAINQLVHEVAIRQRDASTPEVMREIVASLEAIEARMAKLIDDARELGQAATAASSADVADQASSLRQQVAAARNKVGLLRKSLAEKLPPLN